MTTPPAPLPPLPPPPTTGGAPPPPPPPPAAAGLPSRVTGLPCPSCGGALEVDSGARVVHCAFCQTPLLATSRLGARRFAVVPRFDADAAQGAARGWLGSGWNKDRSLPRDAVLGEAFLCYLPFFRVVADAIGWALGTEERTRGSGKNRRTVEVDVEKSVERRFDRTYPAVNVAELGVQEVALGGDRLVAFDADALERSGMVFVPTRSEAEVRDAALAAYKAEADPASGLKRVRFRFLETVRDELTVVYYPLWVVRYRFRNRSYQAVVDAEDGTLAYGKAPGNDLYRALVLVGTEAVVCYAGTTLAQHADNGCGATMAAAVFGFIALAWAWRRFRYGGVVEEGSGVRQASRPKWRGGDLLSFVRGHLRP